jgi:hypothetical protein
MLTGKDRYMSVYNLTQAPIENTAPPLSPNAPGFCSRMNQTCDVGCCASKSGTFTCSLSNCNATSCIGNGCRQRKGRQYMITWGRKIADDWVQGLEITSNNLDAFNNISFYNRGGPVLTDTVNVYLIYVGAFDPVLSEIPKFISQLSNPYSVPSIWDVVRKYNNTQGIPVASHIRVASQCIYSDNGFSFADSKITEPDLSKILGQVIN